MYSHICMQSFPLSMGHKKYWYSVHVYICYLIRCVRRLEALSPMPLYSAIITALTILEQYVINIIMKKYFNL